MDQTILEIIKVVVNILFTLSLGFYFITNLQWYSYKIERVVLHHHRPLWHLFYFLIPFILYYTTGEFFVIFFLFAYLPALYLWHKNLDKKLVFTWRVKRFFLLLLALTFFQDFLCFIKEACAIYGVFMPLVVAFFGSMLIEKYLFSIYKKEAKKKLASSENLKIVAITASYGKTSIKNFLYQILSSQYACYKTPRSVNTLGGIVKDINEDLPQNIEYYIVEAGARQRGDIYEIATFLEPEVAVVGKVGPAHIEYFKNLETIQRTKLELISSPKLKKAFVHCSATNEPHPKVEFFCDDEILDIDATLNGVAFSLKLDGSEHRFHAPNILGAFQALNIYAAINVARYYGMDIASIQKAVQNLEPTPHRLQKIVAGGKIILDDGFNGNLEGMSEAIRLCSLHSGRKVIVTPGLVESSEELNKKLVQKINEVFDIAIVTSKLNAELFSKELKVAQKVILHDKSKLEELLAKTTKEGDIILFANDAPNFM